MTFLAGLALGTILGANIGFLFSAFCRSAAEPPISAIRAETNPYVAVVIGSLFVATLVAVIAIAPHITILFGG